MINNKTHLTRESAQLEPSLSYFDCFETESKRQKILDSDHYNKTLFNSFEFEVRDKPLSESNFPMSNLKF